MIRENDRDWSWFTSDAAGLVICGIATMARGVSYLPGFVSSDRPPAHYLEGILQPYFWAGIWILVGVLCLVAVAVPQVAPMAVGLVVGLHASWGTSFMAGQFFDDRLGRAWVSALSYYLICLLVVWAFGRGRAVEVRLARGE